MYVAYASTVGAGLIGLFLMLWWLNRQVKAYRAEAKQYHEALMWKIK